ncbi:MAG: hypothetical protein ACR2HH_16335 [Chthoniobacterales bacterium]
MRRWAVFLAKAIFAASVFAADELPADSDQPLEIEPPLLIGNRAPNGSLVVAKPSTNAEPAEFDLAKLESDLARARRSAAAGERFYRGGIIAKVEAEERALKVVRLEAQVATAKLQETKRATGESEKSEAVASAEAAAADATKERQRAELEAALRNLERQKKLLALGSGRKSDVNRAERKLAELQRPAD